MTLFYYYYFRMAVEQRNVAIPCEYVYETEKNGTQNENSILGDPYDDESSDDDAGDLAKENNCRDAKISKTSKTKRRSRYDEDMYAMPDPESPEETKTRKLESKVKIYKKKMVTWRTFSMFFLGILLFSIAANVYQAVEKQTPRGKIN